MFKLTREQTSDVNPKAVIFDKSRRERSPDGLKCIQPNEDLRCFSIWERESYYVSCVVSCIYFSVISRVTHR